MYVCTRQVVKVENIVVDMKVMTSDWFFDSGSAERLLAWDHECVGCYRELLHQGIGVWNP